MTRPGGDAGSDQPIESSPAAGSGDRPGTEDMPWLARLLAPATSVAVVSVVIVLLIWINGGSAGTRQSPAAVRPGRPVASGPGALAHSRPPGSAHTSGAAAEPSASAAHRHRPRPSPARHRAPAATAVVTVLNNSTRSGLAHAVAAEVRAKGWRTGVIGNLRGRIAESTLYYAPGEARAARHLAHDFGSIQRVEPNRAGGVHRRALTLVVTRYWTL